MNNAKPRDSIINQKSQISNDIASIANHKSQIINSKHLAFLRHYLKGQSAKDAYRKVYKCKPASAKTSGTRILSRPEIIDYLNRHNYTEQNDTDMELAEHARKKKMDIDIRRELLAGIALGERTYNRYYKLKDQLITMTDELPPNALLRAIDLDAKLETGWYDRKPMPQLTPEEKRLQKEEEKRKKEEEEKKKAMRLKNVAFFFGTNSLNKKYPNLTPQEEKALWQLSLKHEAIDAMPMQMWSGYADCGCESKRNMETGRFYMECPDSPQTQKIIAQTGITKVNIEDTQPLDDEQLADIIKNNPMITAALNNELTITLRPGGNRDDKPKKLWAEREEVQDGHECLEEELSQAFHEHIENDKNEREYLVGVVDESHEELISTKSRNLSRRIAGGDLGVLNYRPVKEIWEEHWKTYQNSITQDNLAKYQQVFAMYKAANLPPDKRKTIELKNQWEFHPDNPQLMRKKSA